MRQLTPPPLIKWLKTLTAALLVVLAVPAAAQEVTIFHTTGGATWDNRTGLVVFNLGDVETRDLIVENRPGWPATATFGVGANSRCAYTKGDATETVAFHNESGTYTGGTPIANACTYLGMPKCSRSGIFRGRRYTANRGYPPCTGELQDMSMPELGPPQQGANNVVTETYTPHTGIFVVRIYGKVCLNGTVSGVPRCSQFGPGGVRVTASHWLSHLNLNGYRATFAPAGNCGPARWPTSEMQSRGRPAYAEWCDFTIEVR